MKFVILALFLSISYGYSNWENLTQNPESVTLNCIKMIDSLHIIACGNAGIIKTSSDGGSQWITKKIDPLNRNLTGIELIDEEIFIIGDEGILFVLDKQGNYLRQNKLNTDSKLSDIVYSGKIGIVIGENGVLFKTIDLGKNWQKIDVYSDNVKIEQNLNRAIFSNDGKLLIYITHNYI